MKINLPNVKRSQEYIQFGGGLDTVSPPVNVPPGNVRRAYNFYEDINGGYATVKGYERFDGSASPSSQIYYALPFIVPGTVRVGDTITGATSGATAKVIHITSSVFVVARVTGTFQNELTTASGAILTGVIYPSGLSGKTGAICKSLAANEYRGDIGKVPGSGSILGVWYYKGKVYAFRNNALATAVGMYVSSSSGWQAVSLGYEVYFSGGSGTAPVVGDTITKGGVSAVVKQVVIESGTFAATTAAGRFIVATVTGGPFTAGPFTAGVTANVASQNTTTIPNINGRFEFITTNFYGQLETTRMYGCDGKNRAFEFDGSTFIPINTGLGSLDAPSHIAENQSHLMLSVGSTLLNSAIGNPLNWEALLGAGSNDVGDTITCLKSQPGSTTTAALAVFCRNTTYILYGTGTGGSNPWQMSKYNEQGGAISCSAQKIIGQTYVMDDRGVTSITTAQLYGNFTESTISMPVQSLVASLRGRLTDSHVARDLQQYRLFYDTGQAIYWTLKANPQNGSTNAAPMLMNFPDIVRCSCSLETYGGGAEVIFFGSDSGYVFQMDTGTSFDGVDIEAYLELAFNNSKSYRTIKHYRHMTFEAVGYGYSEFNASYYLGYNNAGDFSQPDATFYGQDISPAAYWDSFTWDNFVWDGVDVSSLSMATPGNGDNIAIVIASTGGYFSQIKFSGAFIEFTPMRNLR